MKLKNILMLIVILSSSYTYLFATETLTPVHIQSNNASSSLAKVGDNITLTFTSSGAISGVVVTIAGHNVTGGDLTNVGNDWTATYTMVGGDSEGVIPFTIDYTEMIAQVTSTTDLSSVTFDKTAPAAPTISGISAGYFNTNQTFTVSGEASATIEYSTDNGGLWSAYTGAVTLSAEGTYDVLARQTDQAGNGTTASVAITLTIDKTSPAAPIISGISAGYFNINQTFTVSGEAGSTIEYSTDNGGLWTAYSGAVTLSAEGTYDVLARQTDQAGNGPTASSSITLTIDKTTPAAPTISGISAGYFNTNQTFTVSGEASATIEYSTNNGGLWTAYSGAVTLSAEGTYDVLARQTDQAGNGPTASSSITLTIDKTTPAAPTISGISAGFFNTNQTFTVSGEVSATIEYSTDNGGLWSAYTGAVTISAEGNYNVLARQTDQAGNGPTTSAAITLTIDKTEPNAPSVTGTTPSNDQTPTWSWSSGGGGGNGTFRYKLDDNNLTVGATTTVSLSYTPGTNLSEANHTLYVQERDAAGNWSTSGSFTITIDITTQAPTLTLPANNSFINKDVEIKFTLSEAAKSGTVKMTFTRPSATDRSVTFTADFETIGEHTTILNGEDLVNNVHVASGNGNNYLFDTGVYSIKIEYQDLLGNPISSVTNTNIQYGSTKPTPSFQAISSPRNTRVGIVNLDFDKYVKADQVTWDDFTLTRNGTTNVPLDNSLPFTYTHDYNYSGWYSNTFTLDLTAYNTLTDGSYELTLKATGTGIKDFYGNDLMSGANVIWTMDATSPTLTSVHIQSNNANPAFAKPGNEITISFTASETIQTPTATINGNAATINFVSGNSWTAKYTMVNGDTEGNITFNISFQDLAGNNANVTSVTDGSSVTFLKSAPTLSTVTIKSNNANIALAKTGDIITLDFTSAKALANVVATIASHTISASGSNGDKTWTASYTMTGTDSEGTIPFTIDFTDNPGNAGIRVTSTTNASTVIFDRTNPVLTNVTIYSNNTYADKAGVGTKIFVTFTSSENLKSGTVSATIAGNAATISGSNQSWTASYTMLASDSPEGIIFFSISYKDLVGNTGSAVSTVTDGSSVTFDKTNPTLSSISVVSSNTTNTLAKVGDIITSSFTAGEVVEGVSIKLNGKSLTATNPSGNNWTASYTMLVGDAEGSLFVTMDCKDQVGNTAQATNSSITFDKTPPSFTEIKIASNNSSNTSYAKENDEVTITFKTSEVIKTPIVTINSLPATVVNTTGNTWTAKRTMSSSETEGVVTFSIPIFDLTNNSNTSTSTTDASTVTVDRTLPAITSVTVPSGNYGIGNIIVVTILSDNNIYSGQTVEINGIPQSLVNVGGNTYKVYYTVGALDNNLTSVTSLPLNIILKDHAGNTVSTDHADVQGGTLTINTKPTYHITGTASRCESSPNLPVTFTFTGVQPFTFTYNDGTADHLVPSLSSNTYTLNVLSGTFTIVSLADGTTNSATIIPTEKAIITENAKSTITFDPTSLTYNQKDSKVNLMNYVTPINGTFTGEGVGSDGYFYPVLISPVPNTKIITYTYTNAFGCTSTKTIDITVTSDGAYFSGFDTRYCKSSSAATSDIISVEGIDTTNISNVSFTLSPASNKAYKVTSSVNKFNLNPRDMKAAKYTLGYSYKNNTNGNTYNISSTFTIDSISQDINFIIPSPNYCSNDLSSITLSAVNEFPVGGVAHFSCTSTTGFSTLLNNTAILTPSIVDLASQQYKDISISYYYESKEGCLSSTITRTTRINKPPVVDFTLKDNYNYDGPSEILTGNYSPSGDFSSDRNIIQGGQVLNPNNISTSDLGKIAKVTYSYTAPTGCTNTKDRNTVIYKATTPILGLDDQYCYGDINKLITCNPTDGGTPSGIFTSKKNAVTFVSGNSAMYSVKKAGDGIDTVRFNYTIGTTPYEILKRVVIDSIGDVSMTVIDNSYYCKDNAPIQIYGTQGHSSGNGSFTISPTSTAFSYANGIATFKPSLENEGKHTITYTYTSNINNSCSKSDIKSLWINPNPVANFSLADLCPGTDKDVKFINQSTIPTGATMSWNWSFEGQNSTDKDPSYHFTSVGLKTVSLIATTDKGCSSEKKTDITVGISAKADFKWDNECLNGDSIQFTNISSGGALNTTKWKYNEAIISSKKNTKYYFPSLGKYNLELIIQTVEGCTDSTTKQIVIQPYIKFLDLPQNVYNNNFDSGTQNWEARGISDNGYSSWNLGAPQGNIITTANSESNAWYTNIDSQHQKVENSQVVSPCFDFEGLKKPMIKLNVWSSPEAGRDGAVLQSTTDNGVTWNNVGDVNEGDNWFNSTTIQSRPANSFIGWSKSTNGWVSARHDLDYLKDSHNVRFRIVYGTNANSIIDYDGFAFDDIWIGDREQNILTEYFTNKLVTSCIASNQFMSTFEANNSLDVIPIHYHTGNPTGDPLYGDYTSGPSSRGFYYGVSQTPYVFANGTIQNNLIDGTARNTFINSSNKESLQDPKILIDLNVTKTNIGVTLTAKKDLTSDNLVLYCAIVKDSVQAGGIYYYNVLRKFVPNPGGVLIVTSGLTNGQTHTESIPINIDNSPEFIGSKLVLFIQNATTNQVYQSVSFKLSTITDVKPNTINNLIDIYPNPASEYLVVESEYSIERLTVFDISGREVSTLRPNQSRYSIPIHSLENGIYIIKGSTKKGEFIKKFIKQ